jgi:hypothetical protein
MKYSLIASNAPAVSVKYSLIASNASAVSMKYSLIASNAQSIPVIRDEVLTPKEYSL